jgi:hypothetical protein
VLHGDLQSLYYHMVDMNELSPKIQEVMKFQRWLIAKQKSGKTCLEIELLSSVLTLETNNSQDPNFLYICTHV